MVSNMVSPGDYTVWEVRPFGRGPEEWVVPPWSKTQEIGQSWSLVCKLRYHGGDRIQHGMATIHIQKGTIAFFSNVVSPSILRHRRRELDVTSPPQHQTLPSTRF